MNMIKVFLEGTCCLDDDGSLYDSGGQHLCGG